MAEHARILVPSEGANDGDIVQLFGPDVAGDIDWSATVPGARALVRRGPLGRGRYAPAGLAPAGAETNWLKLRSGQLVFGRKEFGVKRYDRDSGAASGTTPGTATIFVNALPLPSGGLTIELTAPVGQCKFSFTKGVFES